MKNVTHTPLALIAADAEDLEVVSAVFQDAVAKIGDMAFLPKERRFALVANRFVWEAGGTRTRGPFGRVRAGLHFDDVVSVHTKNVRMGATDAVVSILSVRFEPAAEGEGGTIVLTLAGDGAIALKVDAITAEARDLTGPWTTKNKPDHETE